MDAKRRLLRRQQLDRQLVPLHAVVTPAPTGGWVKAIRQSLGMSLETLAHRVGVASKSTIHQIERAEVDETISVKRLRATADALGCDLAVIFLPRVPLTQMVEERVREKAVLRLSRIGHSMAMEAQAVSIRQLEEMIDQAAKEILETGEATLWE